MFSGFYDFFLNHERNPVDITLSIVHGHYTTVLLLYQLSSFDLSELHDFHHLHSHCEILC